MPRPATIAALFLPLALAVVVCAAEEKNAASAAATNRGPKLGEPDVQKWKIGMIVSAGGGPVGRLTGTTTIPMPWPEQKLKLIAQDLSPGATVSYKPFGTARQIIVNLPRIADGKEVHAILTIEVTRHTILPPDETDVYVVPNAASLPADFKPYLNASPSIESGHPRIKAIAKQLAEGQTKAWPHVKAIYDWVRKTIQYKKDAPLTTCVEAIDKGTGDCNELTSTFIAICRASGIPARTVRIPGHCYPEFYLEDEQQHGYWFPAEASGTEAFGGIRTHTPILQKGDSFHVTTPDTNSARPRMKTETVRFLPSSLTSPSMKPGGGQPQLKLVCEPAE